MVHTEITSVRIHPLVLVNISDHITRWNHDQHELRAGGHQVVGVIFGYQNGHSIGFFDSNEIPCTIDDIGALKFDSNLVKKKIELVTQVFPLYEFVGWYTVGNAVTEHRLSTHRSMFQFNKSPFCLLMDSDISVESKELPIKIFETVSQVVNGIHALTFVDIEFEIEATESERITVDSIVKGGGGNSSSSLLKLQISDLQNSVQKLMLRIRLLVKYLVMTKEGDIPVNYDALRQIFAICNSMPLLDPADISQEYDAAYNDTQLISFLSGVTKGVTTMVEVQNKLNNLVCSEVSSSSTGTYRKYTRM